MRLLLVNDKDNSTISGQMTFNEETGDESVVHLPEVDLNDFLQNLFKFDQRKADSKQLLPPAVRWISPDRRIVVFERPPMMQYIEYYLVARDEIHEESELSGHLIPIPWTVYFVFFDASYNPVRINTYARNAPIHSMDDKLNLLPLFNFYLNAQLCNPIHEIYEYQHPTIADGINTAYNMVWNSGWNLDLYDAVNTGISAGTPVSYKEGGGYNKYVKYFNAWSKLDIYDILDVSWPRVHHGHGGTVCNPNDSSLSAQLEVFKTELYDQHDYGIKDVQIQMINALNAANMGT